MTEEFPAAPTRGLAGPVVLLVLAITGLIAMAPLMFILALSTAQSYAVSGARGSALAIAVVCVAVLVIEAVTVVRRYRAHAGACVAIAATALALTAITTIAWVLFWLVGLRTITTFS